MGIGRGESPESVEFGIEGATQPEWVETLIERLEVRARGRRQYAGGAEALIRCLSAIVDAVHARPVAVLGHELLHGLEEVDVHAREPTDAGDLSIPPLAGQAIIPDTVPHALPPP